MSDETTTQSGTEAAAAEAGAEASAAAASSQKPVRPDGLADDYWSDEGGVAFDKVTADLAELTAKRQAEAERAANVPEKPEDYEIALPEGFEIPEGLTFEPNPDDPLVGPAREFAKKHGLTKDGFKELVALQLKGQAAEEAAVKAKVAEEMKKLGTKGQARVDALVQQLGGQLGNEAANRLLPMLFTADQVKALETLSKAAAQGGLTFSAAGREGNGKADPYSDEEWARMSPGDRINAARKLQAGA